MLQSIHLESSHVFSRTQVDDLKAKLAAQEKELAIKNEEANKLIQVVGAETEKVSKEKAIADEEEKKVQVIKDDVSKKASDCERDLAKAEPALLAAQAALDTLNKVDYIVIPKLIHQVACKETFLTWRHR